MKKIIIYCYLLTIFYAFIRPTSLICMEDPDNIYDAILKQFKKNTTPSRLSIYSPADYYDQYSTPLLDTYTNFTPQCSKKNRPLYFGDEEGTLKTNLFAFLETRPDSSLYQQSMRKKAAGATTSWNITGAIFFYDKESFDYEFTNFYVGAPVTIDDKEWPTTEHYYQAMKFKNKKIQEKIRQLRTPGAAFQYAQNNSHLVRKDWRQDNIGYMMRATTAKFTQHQDLRDRLLDTGNKVLVEDAREKDTFYGAGADYRGYNHLGRILMLVRKNLREGTKLKYDPDDTFALYSKELRELREKTQ